MKFTVPAIAFALLSTTYPLLASAQAPCNDCDEKSLAQIGECTHAWVDKILYYCQNECKVDSTALIDKCEGGLQDDNPPVDNGTSTTTATETQTSTSTSTPTGTGSNSTTTTTSGSSPTETDGAAAPAFGGIGFGGGAAAMVGLAGLVGLVL